MGATFKVVSPAGQPVAEPTPLSPRLDTLNGKTVGEIWNGAYEGQSTFRIIEEMLRERYPGVKIIPFTEFPLLPLTEMGMEKKGALLDAVRVALVEKGCDALITGNGG
jgi:hypothetical protein